MRFQTNGETVSRNVTKDGGVHLDAIGKFTLRRGNLPSGSRMERGMAAVLGSIPAVGIALGVQAAEEAGGWRRTVAVGNTTRKSEGSAIFYVNLAATGRVASRFTAPSFIQSLSRRLPARDVYPPYLPKPNAACAPDDICAQPLR